MFLGLEFFPVLAATAVIMAVGIVWYAPQVFGRVWAKDLDIEVSSLELTAPGALKRLVWAGVANLFIMIFLAQVVLVAEKARLSPIKVLTALFLIVFFVSLLQATQERKSLVNFCITNGFIAITVIIGGSIIAYWPW